MLTNYSKLLAGQQGTDVPLSNSPSMGRNSRPGPLSPEPQAQGYCSMNRISSAEFKSSKTHPLVETGEIWALHAQYQFALDVDQINSLLWAVC